MPTYRLDLSYDGAGFHGYARQPDVRTVQGELEAALARIAGPVKTVVAGRTDAGVHAQQQVVSFSVDRALIPDRLSRSLTKMLGPEIVVYAAAEVPHSFSARFSATSRTYRYRILNQTHPDPLRRFDSWHVADRLDLEAMQQVALDILGEHNFASFCRRREGASTVRTVLEASWSEQPGNIARFEITGRAFCHQMVRSLVAWAVEAGRGRVDPDSTLRVLEARNRDQARGAAPPQGLVLWRVSYN
ncbi:tRNA pseudouridine(38-40) synthase TruA [Candidatus Poriferisocius sp.]|uniref:tRNA pseudouridine(38-40) synthase TruA n=1 Tax=Candidatus Poriferisocius sp. TaxID=3101276 RepID=UPI003B52A95C